MCLIQLKCKLQTRLSAELLPVLYAFTMHLPVWCSLCQRFLILIVLLSFNGAESSYEISPRTLTKIDLKSSDEKDVIAKNDLLQRQFQSSSSISAVPKGFKLISFEKLNDQSKIAIDWKLFSGPYDNFREPANSEESNNYGSDENNDDEPCLLYATSQQLSWWVFPNGTLVESLVRDAHISALDLSYLSDSAEILYHETSKRQKYFIPFKPLAFSAARNRLRSVPYMALSLLQENLMYLSLHGNNFSTPGLENKGTADMSEAWSWAQFPLLESLIELDLSNCSIQYLGAEVFANVPNLQGLYLSYNRIIHIKADLFKHAPQIMKLDLSYIDTDDLTCRGIFRPNENNYYTTGLLIAETAFNELEMLTFLDLSHTKVSTYSIKAFRNLSSKLQFLSLCYTFFPAIPHGLFSRTDLKVLDLSGNPTATLNLHENCFMGINDTLEVLSFENSRVHDLSWIRFLYKLEIIKLGRNNINVLHKEHFVNLKDLRLLDLSVNHLGNWYHRVFKENEDLRILNLHDNNINMLTSEMYYDFANLSYLALGRNDFLCSCVLRDLIDITVRNFQMLNQTLTVDEEKVSKGTLTKDVLRRGAFSIFNQNDLIKVIKSDIVEKFIPLVSRSRHNIIRYTTNRFNTQRKPMFLSSQFDLPTFSLHYARRLWSDQSNSEPSFQALTGSLIPHWNHYEGVKHSANSQISIENVNLVDDLNQVTIPYGQLMLFKFVLLDYEPENYWCYNASTNTLHELVDLTPCNVDHIMQSMTDLNTTHFLIIGFSALALVIVLIIPFYLKWWYIKYIYFMLKRTTALKILRKEKSKSQIKTNSFMYDIFVSYSDRDRDWVVEELLPNIEGSQQISICLHERDFQVGLSILENIIQCMDKSRCFLLVISKCFLSSQWCQFEMYLAQHRLFEARKEQLILIMLEDIPKNKRPKSLQYLMQIKTYIKWPADNCSSAYVIKSINEDKKLFWIRLNRSLANIENEKIISSNESHV